MMMVSSTIFGHWVMNTRDFSQMSILEKAIHSMNDDIHESQCNCLYGNCFWSTSRGNIVWGLGWVIDYQHWQVKIEGSISLIKYLTKYQRSKSIIWEPCIPPRFHIILKGLPGRWNPTGVIDRSTRHQADIPQPDSTSLDEVFCVSFLA